MWFCDTDHRVNGIYRNAKKERTIYSILNSSLPLHRLAQLARVPKHIFQRHPRHSRDLILADPIDNRHPTRVQPAHHHA